MVSLGNGACGTARGRERVCVCAQIRESGREGSKVTFRSAKGPESSVLERLSSRQNL